MDSVIQSFKYDFYISSIAKFYIVDSISQSFKYGFYMSSTIFLLDKYNTLY